MSVLVAMHAGGEYKSEIRERREKRWKHVERKMSIKKKGKKEVRLEGRIKDKGFEPIFHSPFL